MNKKRLVQIRDYLASPPENHEFGFNMGGWQMTCTSMTPDLLATDDGEEHYCGTVYCIAGLAVVMHPGASAEMTHEDKAIEILDLTPWQAEKLFHGGRHCLNQITVDMAVHAIDTLINTGEVTWGGKGEAR